MISLYLILEVYGNYAGFARKLVPAHTRDAVFQMFCDLRTNSPKDRKWLARHLRNLTPRTYQGWVVRPAKISTLG